ncbi:MAG: nucleotidyltransferase domain-containing protein [Gammaproteobacteria bacterium]|nr:nucleotidyltransferase domain-containing protein [Gammaproteobacteria bacterium]
MATLIAQRREAVANACRRIGARRLDVFGSAARTDFDLINSNLDFLVEFDEIPPAQFADAYFALKESLELLPGRKVDLVTDANLENSFLRERVLTERQIVYARRFPQVTVGRPADDRIVWGVIETDLISLRNTIESLLGQP